MLIELAGIGTALVLGLATLKTWQNTETSKQERLSEERERKAQIYADKDYRIANTEASIFNNGFGDNGSGETDAFSQFLPLLMQNPDIMKVAGQLFKKE